MSILEQYEPKEALHYFEELAAIPHGSGNVKAISDYCVAFGKKHGLEVYQDEMYNVVMAKAATPGYEDVDPIIIQGHMDMVCEKTLDSNIDFLTDGLELQTDGEWLWANGTTLGGDDGIAIAFALAILASDTLKHPRVETIFTVDEEIGLLGAAGIDLSMLKGKKMINIDSEEEGIITVSCAGGVSLLGTIPMEFEEAAGVSVDVTVTGLLGGHSGVEIHKEHGNSNQIMGRVLYEVAKEVPFQVVIMAGGSKDNAIPRHTTATVLVQSEDVVAFETAVERQSQILSQEYASCDPGVKAISEKKESCTKKALTEASQKVLLNTLMNIPNGVQHWSMDIPGLVETSLNMGIMKLEEGALRMSFAVRSSKATALSYLTDRIGAMIELAGGSYTLNGAYPGWEYKKDSELRETVIRAYEELYGEKPRVEAVHAGLECGLLSDKIEGLDAVSIGPDMKDVHTYTERLNIPSTKRTWDLVVKVIAAK